MLSLNSNPFRNLHADGVGLICEWLPRRDVLSLMGADKRLYETIANNPFPWLEPLKVLYPSFYAAYAPNFKRETPYAVHRAVMKDVYKGIPDSVHRGKCKSKTLLDLESSYRFVKERNGIFYLIDDTEIIVCSSNRKLTKVELLERIPFQSEQGAVAVKAVQFYFPLMIIHLEDDVLCCVHVERGEGTIVSKSCEGSRVRDGKLFFYDKEANDIVCSKLSSNLIELSTKTPLLRECQGGLFDIYQNTVVYVSNEGIVIQELGESACLSTLALDPTQFSHDWKETETSIDALQIEDDRLVVFFKWVGEENAEYGCCIVDLKGELETYYGSTMSCAEEEEIKEMQIRNNLLYFISENDRYSDLFIAKMDCRNGIRVDLINDSFLENIESFQVQGTRCFVHTVESTEEGSECSLSVFDLGAVYPSSFPKRVLDETSSPSRKNTNRRSGRADSLSSIATDVKKLFPAL